MKILITGGTGTLGRNLLHQWHKKHQLTVISKDPHRHAHFAARYPDVRFVMCDICNPHAVLEACKDQNVLIHAAAIKDITTSENNPKEAARVNIQGVINAINCWQATGPDRPALLISSDKAVSPLNSYGADKKRGENIFARYGYSALRYGNVVVSQGAFLEKWAALRELGQPVPVRVSPQTGESPTRFIVTLKTAIALVEDAIDETLKGKPGIFVPAMLSAFRVTDVAEALGYPVVTQDLLPGEKLHEELVSVGEGVEPATPIMSRIVTPYWPDPASHYRDPFVSNTAPRISGPEVIKLLSGK